MTLYSHYGNGFYFATFGVESSAEDRRRSRVFTDAWLWCRKSPEGSEIAPGFRHPKTETSVNPAVNEYLLRSGMDNAAK